jgi:hypothetical protein
MCTPTVSVNDHVLDFVRLAFYAEAHPDEVCNPDELCEKCIIARRRDTGEHVLLWLVGEINYSVSRHEPNYERHKLALQ